MQNPDGQAIEEGETFEKKGGIVRFREIYPIREKLDIGGIIQAPEGLND